MRRATATKVLIGLFVVLVPAMLLIEGRRAAREVLAAGLMVGFFLFVVKLRTQPRRDAMRAEARRLRLRFSAKDPFAHLDEPFALFRWTQRSSGEVTNVLWGTWGDLEVRVLDYAYTEAENVERRFSCALAAIPGGWPSLVIRPQGAVSWIADHLALPGIEFESERFNLAFDVRGDDPRFASAVVDARMMDWLLGLAHGHGFEIRGRWILAWQDQVQPWELEDVLRTLAAFVGCIPRAARSLYPEALPRRPDVRA